MKLIGARTLAVFASTAMALSAESLAMTARTVSAAVALPSSGAERLANSCAQVVSAEANAVAPASAVARMANASRRVALAPAIALTL